MPIIIAGTAFDVEFLLNLQEFSLRGNNEINLLRLTGCGSQIVSNL